MTHGMKGILLVATALGMTGPAVAQTSAPAAIITPDQVAEQRAEQALPRKPVAFNPADFDKYTGYYQLQPTVIFTVHRDGTHFFIRLTGQPDVEVFPESPTKFFATVVPAQMSFDSDASGKVTDLVLHQGGLEQTAPRIDETTAKKIAADLEARVKAQTPSPGTEAALRLHLESMEKGTLDLSAMTPALAAIANSQSPQNLQNIQSQGPIKSITFKSVTPNGLDVYDVDFANGKMEWVVSPLNTKGKVSGIAGRRLP